MKMNTAVLAVALLFPFACFSAPTAQMDAGKKVEMDKLMSLMRAAGPYAPGMGQSAYEACQSMANDMVQKYGDPLSQQGTSPGEIRKASMKICLNVNSQAENAQSVDEVDMWKRSITSQVNQDLNDNKQSPEEINFIMEVIEWSAKIAKPLYFMSAMEKSSKSSK